MNFPEQENSDLLNPLRWFDSFIFNNTPYRYREDFFSEARRLHHDKDLKVNIEESSYNFIDFTTEDGANHRTTYSYSNYLSSIIEFEKTKSIKLIKQKAESLNSKEELEYYLKKIIDQLEYLINLLKEKHNTTIREFDCVPKGVYKIVFYLKTAHKSFLPNPLPEIFEEAKNPPMHLFSNIYKPNQEGGTASELIGNIPSNSLEITSSADKKNNPHKKHVVYGFEWNTEPKKYTNILYTILSQAQAIKKEETDFITFSLAFSGEEIEIPLNIKWHLQSNYNSYKAPILRVISHLTTTLKLINPTASKAELARKIHQIFVNPKGEEFRGIEMSIIEKGVRFSKREKKLADALDLLAHGLTDKIAVNP